MSTRTRTKTKELDPLQTQIELESSAFQRSQVTSELVLQASLDDKIPPTDFYGWPQLA